MVCSSIRILLIWQCLLLLLLPWLARKELQQLDRLTEQQLQDALGICLEFCAGTGVFHKVKLKTQLMRCDLSSNLLPCLAHQSNGSVQVLPAEVP